MCHTTFHFIDLFCLLYLQGFMHKTWQSFSYEWNENACHFKSDCSRKNLLKKSYYIKSMLQNFVLRPPCSFHQITLVQNFKVVLKDIFSTFFLLNISWSPKTMGMNWKKKLNGTKISLQNLMNFLESNRKKFEQIFLKLLLDFLTCNLEITVISCSKYTAYCLMPAMIKSTEMGITTFTVTENV